MELCGVLRRIDSCPLAVVEGGCPLGTRTDTVGRNLVVGEYMGEVAEMGKWEQLNQMWMVLTPFSFSSQIENCSPLHASDDDPDDFQSRMDWCSS